MHLPGPTIPSDKLATFAMHPRTPNDLHTLRRKGGGNIVKRTAKCTLLRQAHRHTHTHVSVCSFHLQVRTPDRLIGVSFAQLLVERRRETWLLLWCAVTVRFSTLSNATDPDVLGGGKSSLSLSIQGSVLWMCVWC